MSDYYCFGRSEFLLLHVVLVLLLRELLLLRILLLRILLRELLLLRDDARGLEAAPFTDSRTGIGPLVIHTKFRNYPDVEKNSFVHP